jgi:hypothetical protein
MWPDDRAAFLSRRLRELGAAERVRFTFIPSTENRFIDYFPAELGVDLAALAARGLDYVSPAGELVDLDLVLVTAHGGDLGAPLFSARRSWPERTLLGAWFWDNHLAPFDNLRTALAVDVAFPSHRYCADRLLNPASVLGMHVPACSAQWTRAEAAAIVEERAAAPRSDRLLVNYVDYPFSWRGAVLHRLRDEAPECEVLLMDPGDRSRYFGRSRPARLEEWLGHKASLLLPIDADLSTRAFDALLAGQVLVVPRARVADLDAVIPPATQAALGVVLLPDLEVATVREGAREAARRFDAAGPAGVLERHRFALQNHLLVHRVAAMILGLTLAARAGVGVVAGPDGMLRLGARK